MKMISDIELPTYYYLDHYLFLLEFVQLHYNPILSYQEHEFIKQFYQLSYDGRALYVRLTNRKRKYVRYHTLQYNEIKNVPATLTELALTGFIEYLKPNMVLDYPALVKCFTKAELVDVAKLHHIFVSGKKTKNEIDVLIMDLISLDNFVENVARRALLLTPKFIETNQMLQFLFFGSLDYNLTQFVVRDLGYIKLQAFSADSFSPRYTSRQQAEESFRVELAYQQLKSSHKTPLEHYEWFKSWHDEHITTSAIAKLNDVILTLCRLLEKNKHYDEALTCYGFSHHPKALLHHTKLLKKLGRLEEAKSICLQLMESAQSAEEIYFAHDFMKKLLQRKTKISTTVYLEAAEVIRLSDDMRNNPEQAVKGYLEQKGYHVIYTENYVWRAFFGLLFWDDIYDPVYKALNNPFQQYPVDLYETSFFNKRAEALIKKTTRLHHKKECLLDIEKTYYAQYGVDNPIFHWNDDLVEYITLFYNNICPAQLAAVLLEMAKQWRYNSCGFPDLFCWQDNEYLFVEVKSPNDKLSPQQLKWLEFFKKNDIPAKIIRIAWSN